MQPQLRSLAGTPDTMPCLAAEPTVAARGVDLWLGVDFEYLIARHVMEHLEGARGSRSIGI
jgi:hypothetical protein